MSRTLPSSRRSHSRPKLSPGDINQTGERARGVSTHLGDASKEGNDTHGRHRCRHRPKMDFRPYCRTPPSQPTGMGQASTLVTPQHLNIMVKLSWNSRDPHGPSSFSDMADHPQPLHLPPPAGRDFLPHRCCRSPDSCEATETQQPRSGPIGPRSGPHPTTMAIGPNSSATSAASRSQRCRPWRYHLLLPSPGRPALPPANHAVAWTSPGSLAQRRPLPPLKLC
jgi:hypothetical protein